MSTTTTSLRTIPPSDADSSAGSVAGPLSEPALLGRERSALREILRLVAERADAETKVEADRKSYGTAADAEYQKTRRALIDKLVKLEAEANGADEKRRRAIVDAATSGERNAKGEFAAASRKTRHNVRFRAGNCPESAHPSQDQRRSCFRGRPEKGGQRACRPNSTD